jgi:hypothetical protein
MRPGGSGPLLSRSDGINFHLHLSPQPITSLTPRLVRDTQMISIRFWYAHDHNRGPRVVVVLLRRKTRTIVSLLRSLEKIADKLSAKLYESSHLSLIYEFDGDSLYTHLRRF